jgi:hypothetical protein
MPFVLRSLLLPGLLALLLLPVSATAQEQDADPEAEQEQEDTQQLPEIAPREFEIRGELQIAFPAFERQPLSGFASPPSRPSVPTPQRPYAEPYKQTLDALPERLPTPERVSAPVQSAPAPITGFLEAGSGRYFSRFAAGHFSAPLSPHEQVSVRANYDGSEGFAPFNNANVETPSDALNGRIRLDSRRAPVHLSVEADGLIDDYTLYGVAQGPGAASVPVRTFYSGTVSGRIETIDTLPAELGIHYGTHQYNTTTASDATTRFQERQVGVDGRLNLPLNGLDGIVDGAFSRSILGGDVPGGTETDLDAGASLQAVRQPNLRVRAGARLLWAEGPAFPTQTQSPTASATFVLPSARIEWDAAPWATVFAQNTPRLDGTSLRSYHNENPYTTDAPPARPTVYTTDAQAGLDLTQGWVRLQAEAGYRYAPSYRYYQPQSGRFGVEYESARIVHGGGRLALQGVDNVQAALGVTIRNGTLPGPDVDIPYFASVRAHTMVSVAFADGDGYVQATGTFDGPRPTDGTGTDELGAYVAVDVEGSYSITSTIDLLLRAENLSPESPERWLGYPRPPAQITGGFRIRW